jgi:UDP-glucuronate 4-epimerase
MGSLFRANRFERVVHLAAESSVQYSIEAPADCLRSNIEGFLNILEGCRDIGVEHLVYASSAAVYGANESLPCRETDPVDRPLTLYGASKRSNELMAHVYGTMHGVPSTGLRFFNVYGPWCRSDATLYQFVQRIESGEPIRIFNHGNHTRDFTFIDDIVKGVLRVADRAPSSDGKVPWGIYNIGTGKAVGLMRFVNCIEGALGCKADIELLPLQSGDVVDSCADVSALHRDTGYSPTTSIESGVAQFVEWYRSTLAAGSDYGRPASVPVC